MTAVMPTEAPPDRKADTRQRIVAAATDLFRTHGIDGVGVDAIMRAAGLTHGGFYGHFTSKESLAAEVCGAGLARSAARWEALAAEQAPAEARQRIVTGYLRPEALTQGCVLPLLGADIARRPEARGEATAALQRMAAVLESCGPPGAAPSGLAALATLVGALVLARVAADADVAEAILAAARDALLEPAPHAA